MSRSSERWAQALITLCGWSSLLALAGVFAVLFWNALAAFWAIGLQELLGSGRWVPSGFEGNEFGVAAMIGSTFLVTLLAMVLALPLGIAAAGFLAEFAPARFRALAKPGIELLAAIPSVVIGFLGITIIGPALAPLIGASHGMNALTGAVLLALMALPTIVSISDDSIRAVPLAWREASYALGAGRFQTFVRVVLPGARSGLVAAAMLGVGRAVGETMTVLMATGNAVAFPSGLGESLRTLTATIAIEMGEVAEGSVHYHALFAVGLVLFLFSAAINYVADHVLTRSPT